jgi:hypothetical protein
MEPYFCDLDKLAFLLGVHLAFLNNKEFRRIVAEQTLEVSTLSQQRQPDDR